MKRIDFSGLPKLELEKPHPFSESDEAFGGKSVLCKGSSVKQDLQQLLRNLLTIPAHDYETWRNVCYVLKNEGYDFELFRAWSATADNYDSSACEKLWMDAAVRDDGLRMGTLVHMAQRASQSIPEMRPVPAVENIQKQLEQFYLFLSNNYPDDSRVEIVYEAFEKNGKYIPARSKAAYLSVPVQDTPFLEVFAEAQNNNAAGAWCSLNPVCEPQFLKGKATCDDDVTDYRYALVECDEMTKEEQWDFLSRYHLPIQSVVWSGGKSLHAVVRIEAGDNKQLYKERVDCLYSYLEYLGMPIDKANRNPSRLTRLPGFLRNDELQYCVAYQMGPGSWAAFSPYLELVLDNLSPVSEKLQSGKKITDARTVTSPINGQKGGRPEMPVTDLARDFFQMNKNSDDTPLLRHWCGEWYRYNTVNNRWDVMKQNEL